MNILLCQHGGSGNHGCEALARTAEMLLRKAFPQGNITLYSYRLGDDELYLRDSAMTLAGLRDLPGKYSPHNLCYHLKKRLLGPDKASKLPITGQFRQLLKNADLVVANDVTRPGAGFGVDTNVITLITAEDVRALEKMSKRAAADAILSRVRELRDK